MRILVISIGFVAITWQKPAPGGERTGDGRTGSGENSVVPRNVAIFVRGGLAHKIVHCQLDGLLGSNSDQVSEDSSEGDTETQMATCRDPSVPLPYRSS